ncbi:MULTISPECIES: hypothetical protein [Streptomyces]|uniref:hypothetical protein n=1 Tax=Streptomyces TaxID=1883 RepID=UPI00292F41F4|nr:hypothetical protein [Streptomyces sp. NEAU-HV9]
MTIGPRAALRSRLATLTIAAALTLGTAGCSHGGAPRERTVAASSASPAHGSAPRTQQGQQEEPLAVLKGQHRLQLTLTSARRTAGVVTVRGQLKNTGTDLVVVPAELRGNETAVLKNGPSLAGATLVDFTGGKRYYVLRDTDARPLTTTGLSQLAAGESVAVFMQFPAPPTSTTTVDFELPLFESTTLTLTR